MRTPKKPGTSRIRQRTRALRRAIDAMDFLASGTLHVRTKVCGRPNCRCAVDAAARHGPYHEWSRRLEGRLVHSILNDEQARLVARALENYRQARDLLARWEQETADEILSADDDDDTT